MKTLTAGGHQLEYEWFSPSPERRRQDAPVLVFLHEGLGSLAMWKDFPAQVAQATGCRVLAYSRHGYGKSECLQQARKVDFMHVEALEVLPDVLRGLDIDNPILVGHSDGASIALIHAAAARRPVRGLVLLAPHVFVEDLTVASIAEAKIAYQTTDLPEKLARYHDDPDNTFWGWNNIWLHPEFRQWNVEAFLPRIACPVLAIQGKDDEYGTMAQIDSIARHARDVDVLKLENCRHSPHRDRPDEVTLAIQLFVEDVVQPSTA
ncbi:alpha/beta hydrolase [Herbaspirillum sp. HC18]|nr:alpha/beta hydrolase [Herbaspirillum sp. HC18]